MEKLSKMIAKDIINYFESQNILTIKIYSNFLQMRFPQMDTHLTHRWVSAKIIRPF